MGGEPGNYGKGNLGLGFLGAVADPEARISGVAMLSGVWGFRVWGLRGLGVKG